MMIQTMREYTGTRSGRRRDSSHQMAVLSKIHKREPWSVRCRNEDKDNGMIQALHDSHVLYREEHTHK